MVEKPKRKNIIYTDEYMLEVCYKTNLEDVNPLSLKAVDEAIDYFEELGYDPDDIHVIRVTKAIKEGEGSEWLRPLPEDSPFHTVFQVCVFPELIDYEVYE